MKIARPEVGKDASVSPGLNVATTPKTGTAAAASTLSTPPNVFTPKDGNEYNDGFIIRGLEPWEEDPEGVLVRVFDRWGNKVYEDEFALAFRDIAPQAKVHTLVIPKGAYVSFDDFSTQASDAEIIGFVRAVQKTAALEGVRRHRDAHL